VSSRLLCIFLLLRSNYGDMPITCDASSVTEELDSEPKREGAVIAQTVRGSAPNDVSVTVAELQRIADSSRPSQPPRRTIGRLRIMFVVGSSWPWRAIESDRASSHRRMMCFRDSEQVQRVLFERLDLQRVDEEFVAEHLPTPGSLPGITADWVPNHLFGAMFESYRLGTREERDHTKPDRIVNLAHTLGARPDAW
jgi:hypothetical protein